MFEHVCCSVLQCVAVCCSVLQCVAVCKNTLISRQRNGTVCRYRYGVATISRLLKNIDLFWRISSLLQGSFAKET